MVGTAERWGRLSSTMPSTICGPVLPAFGQGGDYPEGGAVGEFRAACSPFLPGRRVTGSYAPPAALSGRALARESYPLQTPRRDRLAHREALVGASAMARCERPAVRPRDGHEAVTAPGASGSWIARPACSGCWALRSPASRVADYFVGHPLSSSTPTVHFDPIHVSMIAPRHIPNA